MFWKETSQKTMRMISKSCTELCVKFSRTWCIKKLERRRRGKTYHSNISPYVIVASPPLPPPLLFPGFALPLLPPLVVLPDEPVIGASNCNKDSVAFRINCNRSGLGIFNLYAAVCKSSTPAVVGAADSSFVLEFVLVLELCSRYVSSTSF